MQHTCCEISAKLQLPGNIPTRSSASPAPYCLLPQPHRKRKSTTFLGQCFRGTNILEFVPRFWLVLVSISLKTHEKQCKIQCWLSQQNITHGPFFHSSWTLFELKFYVLFQEPHYWQKVPWKLRKRGFIRWQWPRCTKATLIQSACLKHARHRNPEDE